MCGIAGICGDGGDIREDLLWKMAYSLKHRGPDEQDIWCDRAGGIGFAHSRLSILDLSSSGHQPMVSHNGRFRMIYNGEIYNHLLLRRELQEAGSQPRWRGHSDTETLLACFEAWGIEETVKKTVGMFAIAVWDHQDQTLTLVRDRLGEKPLYYGWQGMSFLFGSELKALKVYPDFSPDIDRDALASFMRFGYVPAPQSIYQGVHKLIPGTMVIVKGNKPGEIEHQTYWSAGEMARMGLENPFDGSEPEAKEMLRSMLRESVRLQQISDVPLGAFLSGGIDSSLIVALMQEESNHPVRTFTIGFNQASYNEAEDAEVVANHLGTDHTELYVGPDEVLSVIPDLPVLYDEPFAASSQIPIHLVSKLAREHVAVSLSGDAGDELFGGYNRYNWSQSLLNSPVLLRRVLKFLLQILTPSQWDRMYGMVQPLLPAFLQIRTPGDKANKLASVLSAESSLELYKRIRSVWTDDQELIINGMDRSDFSAVWDTFSDFDSTQLQMMFLDLITYLPDHILCKLDRAAMGTSLETRVPFLDHRIVEFAWKLPLEMKFQNGQGKWILRQLLNEYLPKELIDRPKMGFTAPIGDWLRGPLKDRMEALVSESRLNEEGYLNPVPVRHKWQEHLDGKHSWQRELWHLFIFQSWLDAEQ